MRQFHRHPGAYPRMAAALGVVVCTLSLGAQAAGSSSVIAGTPSQAIWSADLLTGLDLTAADITATPEGGSSSQISLDAWGSWTLPIASTTSTGGAISRIQLSGTWSIFRTLPALLGSGNDSLTLTDLSLDVQTGTVYADVATPGKTGTPMAVFVAGSSSTSASNCPPGTLSSSTRTWSGLTLTSAAASVFKQDLGYGFLDVLAPLQLASADWGSLSVTSTTAVPEPSLAALMALGLGGIALARARRR